MRLWTALKLLVASKFACLYGLELAIMLDGYCALLVARISYLVMRFVEIADCVNRSRQKTRLHKPI